MTTPRIFAAAVFASALFPTLLRAQNGTATIDHLIDQLQHGHCDYARKLLIPIGEPAAERLIPLLKVDGNSRNCAVRVLSDIGPGARNAVPELLKILREPTGGIGLKLKQFKEMAVVEKVATGQAAERAGLLPGDWIVAFNRIPVDELPAGKLDKLIQQEPGWFFITARRKGRFAKAGSLEKYSSYYDPPSTFRVTPSDNHREIMKRFIVRALGKIGPGAVAALPELEGIVARSDVSDYGVNNYVFGRDALESISLIAPASEKDIPHLKAALKEHDPNVRELAFIRISRLKALDTETLFAVREFSKRVMVKRRHASVPDSFYISMSRLISSHPQWAVELLSEPDTDICYAVLRTIQRTRVYPDGSREGLKAASASSDPTIKQLAAEVISGMPHEPGTPVTD